MRIAFIHPRFPSAEGTGATHSATQIVNGLLDSGHEVSVYCTQSPQKSMERSRMQVQHLTGNSRHPHTATRLNKEITARIDELREYDIVHSYLMRLIPSIAKVGKDSDVRTVVTLNAYGGTCAKNDLLYRDQEHCQSKSTLKCLNCIARSGFENENRYLYETASQLFSLQLVNKGERRLEHIDGFQALSPHVKETYERFDYEGERIAVIPNIVDTRFDVEHDTDFEAAFRLLYVGALKKSKGADRLIDIFSRICAQTNKDVFLTIVGDGELRTTIEQQISERFLSAIVEVRGRVPYRDLPRVYASHDVFLYPGRWNEPFGRIFLEAMAAGTPIVATDVGNVREIVADAGVVTEKSVPEVVEGVLSILEQQILYKYSKAGKEQIDQYRISQVIPQFEQLYTSALSR